MPELPEVETFRRYLEEASLHKTITNMHVDAPRMLAGVTPAALKQRFSGQVVRATHRHGKYLFVELGANGWLLVHFGMSGYLEQCEQSRELPSHKHLSLCFDDNSRLDAVWIRRLGEITICDTPDSFVTERGLGPDAFEPRIALPMFQDMVRSRSGALKPALMDQCFIAGIGNIYSDEILFQARIHPKAMTRTLNLDAIADLHQTMHRVLALAIDRQADLRRLPDRWLIHRRRTGSKCPRCRTDILRTTVFGRSSFFCPACQRADSTSKPIDVAVKTSSRR